MKLIKENKTKEEKINIGDIIITKQDSYLIESIDNKRDTIDLISLDTIDIDDANELKWESFNSMKDFFEWLVKNKAKHYSRREYILKIIQMDEL